MYRSILLAVDGSDFAAGAAPVAARLAAAANATLHIVLVHEWLSHWTPLDPAQMTLDQIDTYGRRQSQAYVRQLAGELRAAHGIRVRSIVLEGVPADQIERYAAEQHIGLVVMTSHGRGGWNRLWLGSVADTLVRRLEQPLLLCRAGTEFAPACNLPIKRILVPLDGSAGSERALDLAADLAEATPGSALTLLMVVSPHYLVFPDFGIEGLGPQVTDASERSEYAREYLGAIERRLAVRSIDAVTAVATADDVAGAILEEARRCGADAIAMTTHGRGGVPRLLLGSVADKVIRGADRAVLVCRARTRASRLAPAYAKAVSRWRTAGVVI